MFLDILNFDPNRDFYNGYSLCLCKMADFQNRLISRIFGVFSSGFLHRTTLVFFYNRFVHAFGHFHFWPKLTILQSYSLCKMVDFRSRPISQYLVFFPAFFFCTEELQLACRYVFRMLLDILIFDPNWPFCKDDSLCMAYSLFKMADFQNRLISRIFGVFYSFSFLHRRTPACL